MLHGSLYQESDLEIREYYIDTAGFTDHVCPLVHLLGFAFNLRIGDHHDNKLFIKREADSYPVLQLPSSLNMNEIETHWHEVLHLATLIKQKAVTKSLILRKPASYLMQNGFAKAQYVVRSSS